MLQNFYFTAIRNLWKHKRYAFINVFGLAVGMASFCLVGLYVLNELSFDRFHEDYQTIYRVGNEALIRGEENIQATTSAPMARELMANYPEVKETTRIVKSLPVLIGVQDQKFSEDHMVYGEPSLFEMFDFQLDKGNPKTALEAPGSMVLTAELATKYFGDQDPMGQFLTVDHDTVLYKVTGVLRPLRPNSHIQFDLVASLSSHRIFDTNYWIAGGDYPYTYLRLDATVDPNDFEERIQELFFSGMAPEIEYFTELSISEWMASGNSVHFKLTPLKDIHLRSDALDELQPPGNITYIYIYSVIGMIILVIAIFNFVNLATAHSATRAKEVGVRKVIGSSRLALMVQFMLESVVVSMIATVLATVIVTSCLPYFEGLINRGLAFGLFSDYRILLSLLFFALMVGLLAGVYPAFVLARFQPVRVLKGTYGSKGGSGWLRNLLVTLQFTAAISIIVISVVVYFQTRHMISTNLGFDKDQVLVIERSEWLGGNLRPFKNELLNHPAVKEVAKSITIPGRSYDIRSYRRKDTTGTFLFLNNQVDYDYMDLLGLELVDGRFFSEEFGADSNAVVINEAAADAFGSEEPVGQKLTSAFKKGRTLTVIGVVKDYHIESLHKKVAPSSLELSESWMDGYVNLKINHTHNLAETIGFIEDTWNQHTHGMPFQYFFLDQAYESLYQSEKTMGMILVLFSALSVFIACLGLIGLLAYAISIRQKEIGIRKVLGAGIASLLLLISGNIARLLGVAAVVAWPLAYLATDYWLQNFSQRVSVSAWVYVSATLALTLIVGLFLSVQTLRAAHSNPVDSLRDE
ncbi:MAG: ABC transporter permease [Bacteroidota bacterium]